ncbi:MAG: YigZ family protein [Bacteroidota bacterium]|nr:YigZ family protein [Bacteroidota bacterium]
MESDSYLTIKAFSKGLYREKGSRFIALAYPVSGQEEIKTILAQVRKEYHDARHHCFAWVLGQERVNFRVNDDGEPSGTAGRPIIGQINSACLTDILVIVVRYFGGKLLGTSGLINAYRTSAESAIRNGEIIERHVQENYELHFPYSALNDIMKLVKEEDMQHSDQIFELECAMKVFFRRSRAEMILEKFSRIDGLEARKINAG